MYISDVVRIGSIIILHLSKAMKSWILHTMWCIITGEAAGEIWNWSLLGVKGLMIECFASENLIRKFDESDQRAQALRFGNSRLIFELLKFTGMFINVVARWPGSCHDSHIMRTSAICQFLANNHHSLDDGVLLGDSGYACSPFLMTPFKNPGNRAQEAYNAAHTRTRARIEQTFGRWKRRFHVLHSEVRMAPEKVCLIVGACSVLHNIAIMQNEPLEDEEANLDIVEVEPYHGPEQGLSIREHLCNTFFA